MIPYITLRFDLLLWHLVPYALSRSVGDRTVTEFGWLFAKILINSKRKEYDPDRD